MSGSAAAIDLWCSIGGKSIPINQLSVTTGSYGSVGHATMSTDISMLDNVKVDLVKVASEGTQVPVSISVFYNKFNETSIFGGEFLRASWNFDADTVTINARDWAGVLVDQRRVLTRDVKPLTQILQPLAVGRDPEVGISTMNRQVSQVVTDIANAYGFKPVINMREGSDVPAGAIYGSQDHVFMTIPQSMWSVLNILAKDTGNEVYVTPDKRLVFGEPGAGLPTVQLSWRTPIGQVLRSQANPNPAGPVPCRDLVIDHNPRRNSTFRVLVISYDPASAKTVIGRATYVGDNMASAGAPIGLNIGSAAASADKSLANDAQTKGYGSISRLSSVQLYTFHWDGLTVETANARAGAIATDIAKRLLLMNCRIDGYPLLRPTQKLQLYAPSISSQFSGNTWYTCGINHTYRMPGNRGRDTLSGFWTTIQALDVPSVALGQGATR